MKTPTIWVWGVLLAGTVFGLAGAQTQSSLLVVTKQSHALAVVDGGTLQVGARVPIGEDPHEVVVGPDGRTAYVSNYGEGTLHTIARVDLMTGKALSAVDIAPLKGAHGLYVHGGLIWFTAEGSKALGTLDPGTGRVTTVLGTGQDKTHLVWVSRDGNKVVASNAGSATMSVFDRVENRPVMVPGAPAAPAAYTAPGWRHTLISVGIGAEGFAVSPDERELWVGNADGTLPVIDLVAEKVAQVLPAAVPGANRLAFTPDGKLVLETAHTGKDLVVLDVATRRVLKRVPIEEKGASGIVIEPDGARAFVACPRDHFVAVVDLKRMVKTAEIDAGREPDGMAWWVR